MKNAANAKAWAIGSQQRNGFHVRRVVWGYLMAREECRHGEQIRKAAILVEDKHKRRSLPTHLRIDTPRASGGT